MNQNLNNDSETNINPTLIGNKFKARPAVSILYPARSNYLTQSERIEGVVLYCDKHNLQLMEIYDLTASELNDPIQHQLTFSKILNNIQGQNPNNYPVALMFEEFADINHIDDFLELMDRIDEMVGDRIIEVHTIKEHFIFSKSAKQHYESLRESYLSIKWCN